MATATTTTLTRRATFTAPLAVVPALAPHPDAALIATVETLIAHQAETQRLHAQADAMPRGPEHNRLWAMIYDRTGRYHDLYWEAASLPALTVAGLQAKARLLLQRADLDDDGEPLDDDDHLMVTVAQAILRGAT